MILVEERLKELFPTLPNITDIDGVEHKPKFDFGTEEDLIVFINDNRDAEINTYPLIWVQTPFPTEGKEPRLNCKLKLILAVNSNSTLTNTERLEISFKPILVPLFENVIKAFNRCGFITLRNRDKEKRTNFFNYGVKEQGEKNTVIQTTDIWDAIKFECEIEMSDCPLREINY